MWGGRACLLFFRLSLPAARASLARELRLGRGVLAAKARDERCRRHDGIDGGDALAAAPAAGEGGWGGVRVRSSHYAQQAPPPHQMSFQALVAPAPPLPKDMLFASPAGKLSGSSPAATIDGRR